MGRLLAGLAIWGIAGFSVFIAARKSVQRQPDERAKILWGTGIPSAILLFLICWVPFHLPNQESPAGIVVLLLTWVVGGTFFVLTVSAFAGAITARRGAA